VEYDDEKSGRLMKVYILINKEGEYICKNNGRVYISNTELVKVNTYTQIKYVEK
jgi:hypothetical protein